MTPHDDSASLGTAIRHLARGVSDWVDLAYSGMVAELKTVAPLARGKLLDVGCGDKPHEAIFRPYVSEYVGVEYAETFNTTHASTRSSRPDYLYDGRTLPFDTGTFDTVLSIQVFEHTPHFQRLLQEMARVMKRDGLLIVSVPFSFRLHEEPFDYFRFTPHGLRAIFEAAGLTLDKVVSERGIWSVIGHKLNSYLGFRVARIEGLAQALGKHGHEPSRSAPLRYWTLPVVLPTMLAVSATARVLDRVAPDRTEALTYLALGRAVAGASAGAP